MDRVEGMVSVIIPKSFRDVDVEDAKKSLEGGDYKNIEVGEFFDFDAKGENGKGANWARNQGWAKAKGEFLMFSDCDCAWKPHALTALVSGLRNDPKASYAYCAFYWGDPNGAGQTRGMGPFTPQSVIDMSRFSTMSLFRAADFPGFDENIKRLQDWDVYITLLKRDGRLGICLPEVLFSTPARQGISHGGDKVITYDEAVRVVREKHGLVKNNG